MWYERMDKKLEIALSFIQEIRNVAYKQQKKSFVEKCDNVLSQIKSI